MMKLPAVALLAVLLAAPAPAQAGPDKPLPPAEAPVAATAGQRRADAALRLLAPDTRLNPTEVSVAAARAGVAARPRDADAWHQLGESLEVAGQPEEAVDAFARATNLPPRVIGRAFLYRDLAAARERVGDLAGALAAARVSVRSWPLSRDGLHCMGSEVRLLARLLVRLHRVDEAAAFYRPLYEADRDRAECRAINEALSGG